MLKERDGKQKGEMKYTESNSQFKYTSSNCSQWGLDNEEKLMNVNESKTQWYSLWTAEWIWKEENCISNLTIKLSAVGWNRGANMGGEAGFYWQNESGKMLKSEEDDVEGETTSA